MKIGRKLPILSKKYSRELIYNKKYLKAEKKFIVFVNEYY